MDEENRRAAFNMKVLKRHDPSIVEIVGSAAFVVLYEHDDEWTKTGIEGPMFLYKRSTQPAHGFFVLNRNGVENFSANLTPGDDFELTSDFIIYRAASDDQVLGIWVYDAKERESTGLLMVRLHASSADPPVSAQQQRQNTLPFGAGQSISLDALFGSPAPTAPPAHQQPPSGPALLDSIFQSATVPRSLATVAPQRNAAEPDSNANGLKSYLGLSPPSAAAQSAALPQGLEAIFASARISPHVQDQQAAPLPASGPALSVDAGYSSNEAIARSAALSSLDESMSQRPRTDGRFATMDKRTFVREILSLIHTDKEFVDDLYQRYVSHSS